MTVRGELMSSTAPIFDVEAFFAAKPTLICDIETYHGYFLIAFKRVSDGKIVSFEMSRRTAREDDDRIRQRVRSILLQNRIVTFNGMGYDMPLIWYFVCGATNAQLKQASDRIILGNVRYWEIEKLLGIKIPREIEHWDLMEPQPNAFASLKTLNGRMHGRTMQDLPIEPDATLTDDDMDLLTRYCANDLTATEELYHALREPLALRAQMGAEYRMDFMSKSDSQLGEAIIKRRVEQATGQRIERVDTPPGTAFPMVLPPWADGFRSPQLIDIRERLRGTQFVVRHDGKVDLPKWLADAQITIGETTYAMGIGGLHSTEAERTLYSDYDHVLIDADVESQYPNIILSLGMYPRAIGRRFLDVYGKIKSERIAAKAAKLKAKDQGLKIALNGGGFGKLGSKWSVLYAPHLLIGVTLTGQLSLLLLIERAEAAGISVVSGNTDGVIFRCPRVLEPQLMEICQQWERDTTFKLEFARYKSIHNASVNTYIAIKEDGSVKRKGTLANPWRDGDIRGQLMKNPTATICGDAVVDYLTNGTPIEETIRACSDVRSFVTVVNVQGGGTWRGEYLGKVVRYIWSCDGDPILYKKPHPITGNHKKVPKSDGCRPVMTLPSELPVDIDYERYVAEAEEICRNIGAERRPLEPPRVRVLKRDRLRWLVLSIAA